MSKDYRAKPRTKVMEILRANPGSILVVRRWESGGTDENVINNDQEKEIITRVISGVADHLVEQGMIKLMGSEEKTVIEKYEKYSVADDETTRDFLEYKLKHLKGQIEELQGQFERLNNRKRVK